VLNEDEFKGATGLTISGETAEEAKGGAEKSGIKFPVIADPELKIIDAWGLRHDDAVPGKNTARPAAFFVNAEGKVVRAIQPENYRTRLDATAFREGLRLAMGK